MTTAGAAAGSRNKTWHSMGFTIYKLGSPVHFVCATIDCKKQCNNPRDPLGRSAINRHKSASIVFSVSFSLSTEYHIKLVLIANFQIVCITKNTYIADFGKFYERDRVSATPELHTSILTTVCFASGIGVRKRWVIVGVMQLLPVRED